MKKRNIKFLFLLFILFTALSGGCAYSLERDASCPPCVSPSAAMPTLCPPCWQGLIPGQSSEQDVMDFLEHKLTQQEKGQAMNSLSARSDCQVFRWLTRQGSGIDLENRVREIHVEHGKISYILVEMPWFGPTMEDVIEIYGPPEYVFSLLAVGPDGEHYILEVYYPSRGLAFKLHPTQVRRITPRTRVSAIEYYTPGDIKHFFIARSACFHSRSEDLLPNIALEASMVRPWAGFGEIEVLSNR